jgi:hypothetical protein
MFFHLSRDKVSAWYRRTLQWDPAKERFIGDAEANKWLDRERRPPWQKSLG